MSAVTLSSPRCLALPLVDVVCPQCTSVVRADPGSYARCAKCGYSGGSVPTNDQVQVFSAPHAFLPSDPFPQEEEEDDLEEKAPVKETSRVALTALILGLAGILPVAPPVAIGFGIAGIVHVNNHSEEFKGKGLAVIGLVFGVLFMTVWFIVIVSGLAAIGSLLPG